MRIYVKESLPATKVLFWSIRLSLGGDGQVKNIEELDMLVIPTHFLLLARISAISSSICSYMHRFMYNSNDAYICI